MKNKTLIALGLLTTLALPLAASAGTEMHGGDSVVCFQNTAQKKQVETILRQNKMSSQMGYVRQDPFTDIDMNTVTVETLDLWENRQSTMTPGEFIKVEDVNEGVKNRLEALNNKLSFIASKMQAAHDGFYNPSKWLASSTGIVEIDDSHELINYTNLCIPVQIAIQTNTRVYYDARLYSKLDNVNKTALILHELMYSWVKTFSDNSFNVRKYIGLLMLKDFDLYPFEELYEELKVDLVYSTIVSYPYLTLIPCKGTTTLDGLELKLNYQQSGFNPSECNKDNSRFGTDHFKTDDKGLADLSEKYNVRIKGLSASKSDGIIKIYQLSLADGQTYKVPTITPFTVQTDRSVLRMEDGKINQFISSADDIILLDQKISTHNDSSSLEYSQTSSGKTYLSRLLLGLDTKLKSVSGFKKLKNCKRGDYVIFNPEGLVLSCNH